MEACAVIYFQKLENYESFTSFYFAIVAFHKQDKMSCNKLTCVLQITVNPDLNLYIKKACAFCPYNLAISLATVLLSFWTFANIWSYSASSRNKWAKPSGF